MPLPNNSVAARFRQASRVANHLRDERMSQVIIHGYTTCHDDEHQSSEIAQAAAAYAIDRPSLWPWEKLPEDLEKAPTAERRRKQLVKAGALIMAEIERLDRKTGRDW